MVPDASVFRIPALSRAGLTWLDDDMLVYAGQRREDAVPEDPVRLWQFRIGSLEMMEVPALGKDACPITFYREPARLPDGRLGAVKQCGDPNVRPPIDPVTIVALDTDGTETILADFDTLGVTRVFVPVTFSFAPGLQRGMASVFGGICSALVWIEDGRVRPVEVEVGDGDQRYALGTTVAFDPPSDCESTGQSRAPAWSPDGHQVAFLASPSSVGIDATRRLEQPYELYVMDADDLQPRPIVEGIGSPRGLHWSPDGKLLLLTGIVAGQGAGTWTVEPNTGELRRVAAIGFDWVTWSPDGTAIAGLHTPVSLSGPLPSDSFITIIRLHDSGGS